MGDEDEVRAGPSGSSPRLHCPIKVCVAHSSSEHNGWETFAGLRAHVDAHLLGLLPGAPPQDWLRARNVVGCRERGRLVSRRCNGGARRTGEATQLAARPQPIHLPGTLPDADPDQLLGSLPSLSEICAAPIGTRDLVSSSLLPMAQKEFLRCVAQVLQHNCADAWADPMGGSDTVARKRRRLAWLELWSGHLSCVGGLGHLGACSFGGLLTSCFLMLLAGAYVVLWVSDFLIILRSRVLRAPPSATLRHAGIGTLRPCLGSSIFKA